jgi:protein gp37
MPHIWMGTSIGARSSLWRLESLRATPAIVRFVSFEPLIEDLGPLDLRGISWAIVGGESGDQARVRPMDPAWARSLRDQCQAQGVSFFFKQHGEYRDGERLGKRRAGRLLDGRELQTHEVAMGSAALAGEFRRSRSAKPSAGPLANSDAAYRAAWARA